MTAGTELNALVAQYVLGHEVIRQKKGGIKERTLTGNIRPLRNYCTDIHDAWEVVEKLAVTLIPVEGDLWFGIVGTRDRWKGPAEFMEFLQKADFAASGAAVERTAPLTVCLAALKAVSKRLPPDVLNETPVNV